MDAHEAKCFIKLIQILFKMLLGFNLSAHGDHVQTLVAQDNLHINPLIKIVEGGEDFGLAKLSSCPSHSLKNY